MDTMNNDQKNLQSTLGIPFEIQTCLYLQLLTVLSGIYAREMKTHVNTKIFTNVHSSPVYNRQKLRATACISGDGYLEFATAIL